MAAHPEPFDLVRGHRRFEALPEIEILDRLLLRRLPAARLPGADPARDAIAQILAVGVDADAAGALQRFQRGDRRHHLHAVVGGLVGAARQLLLDGAVAQDGAPAAWPRIAAAGSVGEDVDDGTVHARP